MLRKWGSEIYVEEYFVCVFCWTIFILVHAS
jgi:hypothetical protein